MEASFTNFRHSRSSHSALFPLRSLPSFSSPTLFVVILLFSSASYYRGAADQISSKKGTGRGEKSRTKVVLSLPASPSKSKNFHSYDVTLPTPLQIGDGLPVPLARGSFAPQCKTTLINGRRHTDCRGQNLGPSARDREEGDEEPLGISMRGRLAALIDPDTTVLLLADNALGPKIALGTFSSLSALHSLDLSANRVTTIEAGAFKGVINLSELDLSNNRLSSIPIESLTDTPYLQQLKLNNNIYIKRIENDSFIHLKHLQRLELHGCMLTTVEPLAFRGVESTLQFLDISGNRLHGMSEDGVLDSLRRAKSLRSLYLYENPWRCDCHLRWLKSFVDGQRITYEQDRRKTLCDSPTQVIHASWDDLTLRQFACAPELLSSSKLDILVDERGGATRVDGVISGAAGVNLTCKVYSDPEVNPVWYKDENRIHTMSELAEMATTIVISTLPPSSPGPVSPATPPRHLDATPSIFANPPLDYRLYAIYNSGRETKTSVLYISQVNNVTKGNYRCVASNIIGNVTMRVSLSLRSATTEGQLGPDGQLVPAAAAATLPSAATQLGSEGSAVEGRAAGGRRGAGSTSGLMIGIIVAGLVVFILVTAAFFYLDYSRKRRWATLQGLTRGGGRNVSSSDLKSVVIVCPSLCWWKPAPWIHSEGTDSGKDVDDDIVGDPLASVLDPTTASASTEYLKMEDLGSTPSRSLDPLSLSSGGGGGGGANDNASLLMTSFPHRDSHSGNRSEDPLLIHHLPVERIDDDISSQSDEGSEVVGSHTNRTPKPKPPTPLNAVVDSSSSATSSVNNVAKNSFAPGEDGGGGIPISVTEGLHPVDDPQVLGHSYISYHSNKAHMDDVADVVMGEEDEIETTHARAGMYVTHARRTENGFPSSRSCIWPASPSDPESFPAAALLDAPLVFPVVSAITTSSIPPIHPLAPPLQNPLHPCYYGHHNLLSLSDFDNLISEHHQPFGAHFVGAPPPPLSANDDDDDDAESPLILAAANAAQNFPQVTRTLPRTSRHGGAPSEAEGATDAQHSTSSISRRPSKSESGSESKSKNDDGEDQHPYPTYLDRIGTAV